jgi:hypothetical protein
MNNLTITYRFRLPDATEETFTLELDSRMLEPVGPSPDSGPEWAKLEFHQCPNCLLNDDTHPYCPLSRKLVNIVKPFDHIISHETIHVDVLTKERNISRRTTAQKGLSSLMGLIIATSGCPHTVFLKPMARFHLPLASVTETIYRASSMYLTAQSFLKQEGKEADFSLKGLEQMYDDLRMVNIAVANRLRSATGADSSVNAIVILDAFAMAMPTCIDASLKNLQPIFAPYLEKE